jgi:ferric-dicitrate binding protein FerR (iron transport regulator)
MTLTAGQGAAFDISTQKLVPKNDINAFAWKSKVLKFQNTPTDKIIIL